MKINTNQDIYLYENYEHGFPHIHPDRAMIKTKTLYETLFIVKANIEKYKKVELDLLREELLK